MFARTWQTANTWRSEPDLSAWVQQSHLNLTRSLAEQRDDPDVRASLDRLARHAPAAIERFQWNEQREVARR